MVMVAHQSHRLLPSALDIRKNPVGAILPVQERKLLFCIASRTDWQKAGVTGETVTTMVIKGLLERDAAGHVSPTNHGRAMLAALFE
jgi:hypothetical protein